MLRRLPNVADLPRPGAAQVQLKRTPDKRGWPSHHLAVLVRQLHTFEGSFDAVPPVDEENVAPWKRGRTVTPRPASALPELASCSGRTWRLWLARCSQAEASPPSAHPLPRVLELRAPRAADFTALSHRRLDAEPLDNIERVLSGLSGPAQRLPPSRGGQHGPAYAAIPPRPRPHGESRPVAVVASHAEGEDLVLSKRNATGYKGVVSRGAGFALQKSALARAGLPAAAAVLSFETATAAALYLARAAKTAHAAAAHAAAAPPSAAAAAAAAVQGEVSAAFATPDEGGYAANDTAHPKASVGLVASGAAAAGGRAGARRGRRALRVGDTVEVEVEEEGEARWQPYRVCFPAAMSYRVCPGGHQVANPVTDPGELASGGGEAGRARAALQGVHRRRRRLCGGVLPDR